MTQALSAQHGVAGLMLQEVRDDFIVPLIKASGFDLVIVDREHGAYELREVARLAMLSRLHGLACVVRPPDHTYGAIAPVLDAGAAGIMVSRIEHPDQVRQVLSAMKYPPVGERGMASQRAHTGYLPAGDRRKLADDLNSSTLLVVQIELAAAVDRIDDILSVPGIDYALVGPSDLSLSMGCQPGDETMRTAIAGVVAAGKRHGVKTGLQTGSLAELAYWRGQGMALLVAGTDLGLLTSILRTTGNKLAEALGRSS